MNIVFCEKHKVQQARTGGTSIASLNIGGGLLKKKDH
jgi:hypothetical protein